MDKTTIDRLRKLRKKANDLATTLVKDLKPFLHEKDEITFRRLPNSDSELGDVGITTTCSCLMSLSMADKIPEFYGERFRDRLARAFNRVVKGRWESSGLLEPNSFTPTIVLRTAGFLRDNNLLSPDKLRRMKHKRQGEVAHSFFKIASNLAEDPEINFRINEYPANPTIVYWFVDAVHRARFKLAPESWKSIFAWATQAFSSQLSLVFAEHEALMDPVALAMAACLAAKLRHLAEKEELGTCPSYADNLPSNIELKCSIVALFKRHQRPTGIWPKYFPLFNYANEAGSNYCFTFEMLEAILNEFGDSEVIVNNESVFGGLKKTVDWCRDNRLEYLHNRKPYTGWNSGGQIQTLKKGMPESWATAVVHMFLQKLQNILSNKIQEFILEQYNVRRHDEEESKWDRLIDINIKLTQTDKKYPTLKDLLEKHIINDLENKTQADIRQSPLKHDRSVLLFGPPGTSKTVLVRELAKKVKWPLIEIDPSSFLRDDLINIYSQTNKIFNDLVDLAGVVILFDEMDSLVLTREKGKVAPLDATSRFLTTCMLPKLARLHDLGQVVFFMTTNYQEMLDPAIKRSGRFDLRLFVGPPAWESKLDKLEEFFDRDHPKEDIENAKKLLKKWTIGKDIEEKLDYFTYSELKAFFSNLRGQDMLVNALTSKDEDGFIKRVEMWYNSITLADTTTKEQYKEEKDSSRLLR